MRRGIDLVQRLDARTGAVQWQWQTPAHPHPGLASMAVAGVATQGGIVVLAGFVGGLPTGATMPGASATSAVGAVGRRYVWPKQLGPVLDGQFLLALDATTGRPRWLEDGAQEENLYELDGAMCEVVNSGFECRDDRTGAPTQPLVRTGRSGADVPPYINDGYAGLAGDVAAVVVGPAAPGDRLTVLVVPVRGGSERSRIAVSVDDRTTDGSAYRTFVVAAGALPHGQVLLLLRRIDDPAFPLVALRLGG